MLLSLMLFSKIFGKSHITTASGCEVGLNANNGNFTGLLNTMLDIKVQPHCDIQCKPFYLIPPQSPNTDTGRAVLALPHKSQCQAGSN